MEKIKINNGEVAYEIESIRPVTEHVLQIVFADEMPQEYGDITVYTSGGLPVRKLIRLCYCIS